MTRRRKPIERPLNPIPVGAIVAIRRYREDPTPEPPWIQWRWIYQLAECTAADEVGNCQSWRLASGVRERHGYTGGFPMVKSIPATHQDAARTLFNTGAYDWDSQEILVAAIRLLNGDADLGFMTK